VSALTEPLALPAPTIALALELPKYGVKVTVGVPTGARLLDVWRVGPSGTVAYVRANEGRAVTGPTTAFAHDFEAPFGVPLVYSARVALADGSNASTVSAAPFTLTPPTKDPWVVDLLRPSKSQSIVVESYSPLTFDAPVGVHRVIARRDPVVTADAAWTPDATLVVVTLTEAAKLDLRDTIGSGVPVLLRTLPEQGPGNVYLTVKSWTTERVSRIALYPERRFTIETTQIARPDPALFAPVGATTYATVKATFATYSALLAFGTYDDVLYDFSLVGPAPTLAVPWPPRDV
jgi:hypothetical protein